MDKIIPIKCGNVNCYVISGDSGSVLVDTGRAGNRDYLLNALKNYNIKLIVLTDTMTTLQILNFYLIN